MPTPLAHVFMRVVLFRTDKIGDLIVTTPVIAAIKAKHPHARIMLVTAPYNAVAAEGLAGVDETTTLDQVQPHVTLKSIREFKPTHALVFSPKDIGYKLSRRIGAAEIGWVMMSYRPLTRLHAMLILPQSNQEIITRSPPSMHHADHVMNLARNMGLAAAGEFPYTIARDISAAEKIKSILKTHQITRPFIAVHLVDKWISENWHADDVKHFLLMLRDKLKVDIVASAGPAETILSSALEQELPVLKGLSFGEWTELFEQSKMVITPDCAAVHMACALQKPLLALYQPSRFEIAMTEYGPRLTDYRARALHEPKKIIPFLFRDICDLLGHTHV